MTPIGFVDVCGPTRLSGWVWIASNPDIRLTVSVEIDDVTVATTIADNYRPDLQEAGKGDGRYGFSIAIPELSAHLKKRVRCLVMDGRYSIALPATVS